MLARDENSITHNRRRDNGARGLAQTKQPVYSRTLLSRSPRDDCRCSSSHTQQCCSGTRSSSRHYRHDCSTAGKIRLDAVRQLGLISDVLKMRNHLVGRRRFTFDLKRVRVKPCLIAGTAIDKDSVSLMDFCQLVEHHGSRSGCEMPTLLWAAIHFTLPDHEFD